MKAARLSAYGKPLTIEAVPRPEPGPGQVLVKIAGAGFCHSDLHVISGELKILPRFPITLGHENAGYVAAAGAGVTLVKEGDPVAVFGGWGCRVCDHCVSGQEQLCAALEWAGLSRWDGGYAQYLLVPRQEYLVPLTKLDPRLAAPLTDAALTPYRAVRAALPYLAPDHYALVIGLGGLGQYGLKLLRLLCACPVIAVDVDEEKLAVATGYGAAATFNAIQEGLRERILELTSGKGVCAAFDFVGAQPTLDLAVGCARAGGKVTQIGLAGGEARLKVLENSRFEVVFATSLWGTVKELREVVALAESGRLELIDTELAPLDEIEDVRARLARGEVKGRVVMTP